MKQPVKRNKQSSNDNKKRCVAPKMVKPKRTTRSHPKYGTSKLEEDFARDFLDKLGVNYSRQYEAKEIGRFYDFVIYLDNSSGVTPGSMVLVECDGGYYHSDPRIVKEDKMNPMQKRNKRVDEHKDKWALMHGIPLIRIWEKDIRENPNQVMKELKERLYIQDKKVIIAENKSKRHKNNIR